jgi:chromosome segregation ATPase
MDRIYERARLYKAIVAYEKEKKNSPEKEYMVLKKLEENNAYFMNLTAEDKKTFDGIFREADDNLGKSAEWQNYFMIYTDLQVMALNNQINSYLLQGKEKKEQIKRFEDAKNALQDAGNKLRYNAANTIAHFQEAEKEENKLIEAKKKLKDSRLKEKADVADLYEKVKDVRNDIGKHPGQLESLRHDKKDIISTLKYFNKLKTEAETEYANSQQAIETELKNDKNELENMKNSLQNAEETFTTSLKNLYAMDETYKENETVKELIATRRSRKELYNYQDKIEELRNDPRFGGDSALWTYGENDDWIQEKYPWIKELVEKYVDIPSYEGQPGYNMILDEDIDNALNNAIEELDEKVENMEKELPQDIAEVYHGYLNAAMEADNKRDELNEKIPGQEQKVKEQEEQAPKKLEEAKKTFDKAVEEAYDQFNPRRENGGSFLHYELFEGDYKTFPEQVEGVVKKLEEKIEKKEAELPELQQKLKEAETTYEKAKQNFLDGEKNYEAADTALYHKVTEAGYAKKKYEKDYLQLKPAIENFAKTYRATFDKMPSQEYTEMVPLIQEQAKEWLKVEGMHAGDHKNSVEYARMIASVKIVANFPGSLDEKDEKLFKEAELPGNINQAVAFMKEQAENYQKAKDKQWRPFPSRMRTHRKNVAKFLIGFADKAQKGMDAQKEVVELDQYLLTEGKSKGLDLTRDNLISKVMGDEKLEHPRGRKQLDGIVVKKTDTLKEKTEIEAPELEDDGGMSMG